MEPPRPEMEAQSNSKKKFKNAFLVFLAVLPAIGTFSVFNFFANTFWQLLNWFEIRIKFCFFDAHIDFSKSYYPFQRTLKPKGKERAKWWRKDFKKRVLKIKFCNFQRPWTTNTNAQFLHWAKQKIWTFFYRHQCIVVTAVVTTFLLRCSLNEKIPHALRMECTLLPVQSDK